MVSRLPQSWVCWGLAFWPPEAQWAGRVSPVVGWGGVARSHEACSWHCIGSENQLPGGYGLLHRCPRILRFQQAWKGRQTASCTHCSSNLSPLLPESRGWWCTPSLSPAWRCLLTSGFPVSPPSMRLADPSCLRGRCSSRSGTTIALAATRSWGKRRSRWTPATSTATWRSFCPYMARCWPCCLQPPVPGPGQGR